MIVHNEMANGKMTKTAVAISQNVSSLSGRLTSARAIFV